MQELIKESTPTRHKGGPLSQRFGRTFGKSLWVLLLACTTMFSACGGSSSSAPPQLPSLSGNWQFTVASPPDQSFLGGLLGGFLLQTNGSVTGSVGYSISLPAGGNSTVCSSGSAAITGTISGQSVSLTAVAGTQTFTFTGTMSLDGSTMVGAYSSTAGTAANGTPCGTAQTELQWNAIMVPPLSGPIQGTFHSTGGLAGLNEQEFLVTGVLTQAPNTGADNAAVTGNLNFSNSDYPCFVLAYVTGEISGNSVALQINAVDGSNIGQIGPLQGSSLQAVTFNSTQGGYALQSLAGAGYAVYTPACGGGTLANPADFGNICLAVNGTTACQQPIMLIPSFLSFPSQSMGSAPTTQAITLTNASGVTQNGVTLTLTNNSGATNFTETDACGLDGVPSQGQPVNLIAGQACLIKISFAPLETCAPGTPPGQCPSPLSATLTVSSQSDTFAVPITGTGVGPSAVLNRARDFRGEDVLEASLPQFLWRSSQSASRVQTLPQLSTRSSQYMEHHADSY